MKTLFLLRHAKSSRDDAALRDFDRPLNDRGKDDAKLMGGYVRRQQFDLEAVISSPAKRARRTTEIFLKAAGVSIVPSFDERIYDASLQQLATVVSEIDPTKNGALLIGHNPGFEELVDWLTGEYTRMPTAALAVIDLHVDLWREVRARSGKVRELLTPKGLKNS